MSERLRSYSTARTIFSALEFFGWVAVILGLIVGAVLAAYAGRYTSDIQKWILFLTGASGSLVGLFYVGAVQGWRANVDAAEYSQQSLKIARAQLLVSEQSLKLQRNDSKSFADMSTAEHAGESVDYGAAKKTLNVNAKPKPSEQNSLSDKQTENIEDAHIDALSGQQVDVPTIEIQEKGGRFFYKRMSFSTRKRAEEYASRFNDSIES